MPHTGRRIDRPTAVGRWIITWSAQGLVLWLLGLTPAVAGYHSMTVTVTAYNSTPEQTDGDPSLAAWGDRLKPGMHVIAVSPDLLRLGLDHGTDVAIEGFEHDFTVLDRTSSSMHRRVDIYMGQGVRRAREFGRQHLRIWWHTPD